MPLRHALPFAAALLLSTVPPSAAQITPADMETCAKAISATCLIDLGVKGGLISEPVPRSVLEVHQLALQGRVDVALALQQRVRSAQGQPDGTAQADIDRTLASQRITTAVLGGTAPRKAVADTPQAAFHTVFASAQDLLGRSVSAARSPSYALPDATTLAKISELAAILEDMAKDIDKASSTTLLLFAAELYAAIGDRTGALRALGQIHETNPNVLSLTEDLIRLAGSDITLGLCRDNLPCLLKTLPLAAAAAPDAATAKAHLSRAFDLVASTSPVPAFEAMPDLVKVAADLGYPEFARQLADEVARLAAGQDASQPVFPDVAVAEALFAADVPLEEADEAIATATAPFLGPNPEIPVPGETLNGDQNVFAMFGVGARRRLALLQARMGHAEVAASLLVGLPRPHEVWYGVLKPDLAVSVLDALLKSAQISLTAGDFAWMRAILAERILLSEAPDEHRLWAVSLAEEVLADGPFTDQRAMFTYTFLVNVGTLSSDADLRLAALTQMGDAALRSGNWQWMLSAGVAWDMQKSP